MRASAMRRSILVGTVLAAFGLVGTGYVIGKNHSHLLTCEDFEISGHYVPDDCRRVKSEYLNPEGA